MILCFVKQSREAKLNGLTSSLQSPFFDLLTHEYLLFDGFFSELLPEKTNTCTQVAFGGCQLFGVPDQTYPLTLLGTCSGLVAFPL